ncbi:MAG: HypC/HybG/HupF family hydrogenase formation chaperone [Clostridia bacterium]|jgi:hydrogenase expression/formation protein HypC|nr:HypC/HybG/HupF family hydrogenase formation chaperone [Clostridia bacterium]MDD4572137.1 HypC/HybG/HupF family hydrogenase formation chaperone [Clostridia bacterium]
MCIAIPAKVIHIDNEYAQVDIMGLTKEINIQLVSDLQPGNNVMVHAGFAISKISTQYYDFLNESLNELLKDTK